MRKRTRLKRERGFGACLELPLPVYCQGAMMGLLDPLPEPVFYVLPDGAHDMGRNYVRCRRYRPDEQRYVPGPLKAWNPIEEKGEPLSESALRRVIHFGRGMLRSAVCDAALAGEGDDPDRLRREQLYLHYTIALSRRISEQRNWNMLLSGYVLGMAPSPQRDWMRTVVLTGYFDAMIEAHERLFTVLDPVTGEGETA